VKKVTPFHLLRRCRALFQMVTPAKTDIGERFEPVKSAGCETRGTRAFWALPFGAKFQPFVLALPARDLLALSHCFVYVRAGRAGRAGFQQNMCKYHLRRKSRHILHRVGDAVLGTRNVRSAPALAALPALQAQKQRIKWCRFTEIPAHIPARLLETFLPRRSPCHRVVD
jgi:hypothetical protein